MHVAQRKTYYLLSVPIGIKWDLKCSFLVYKYRCTFLPDQVTTEETI